MLNYLKVMRPKQWTKNLIIFAGLVFSNELNNLSYVTTSIKAFLIFCVLSGVVYIINDIIDIEKDKNHPTKKFRPIASGKVNIKAALVQSIVLGLIAVILSFQINIKFGVIAVCYLSLIFLYSIILKHIVIVDVLAIAGGFVLRAVAGGFCIKVPISEWLLLCTVLLALFLGLCKRRHELVMLDDQAAFHREILDEYSPQLLDQMIPVVTASTVMTYALYTMSGERAGIHMMVTLPFVLYGIFRYLYLVYKKDLGGNPSKILLDDKPLLFSIGLWMGTVIYLLYFK
jgi:4-hydroxybenzoate polyprenyltransferase